MSIAPSVVADAIASAPAWALVSLTMPDDQLRMSGADELARWIVGRIDPQPLPDPKQMLLPLA